jgi:lycopene cyclase domain-containing protein
MKFEYFLLLVLIGLPPLVMSRDRNIGLRGHGRALALAIVGACVPFWVWDVIATARGHWTFNPAHVLGVSLAGLPLEEWLFFVVVSFVSIFTWESVKYFRRGKN